METKPEGQAPQNEPEVITIPKDEWEITKHRADVSSQNFERLKKLEEEKIELEAQLLALNTIPPDSDQEISVIKSQLSEVTAKLARSDVQEIYPILKEVWSDFEQYHSLPENIGMNLKTAAKAFLIEKDLLGKERPGLENPTGGPRVPIASGMTVDEVSNLRKNNPKKYLEMLKKGQLVIND